MDYEDTQGFCGGQSVQWRENRGRCGLCGDPYNGPREHEAGGEAGHNKKGEIMTISKGRYATGVIVGSYRAGGLLDVSVEVTANHGGQRNLKGLKCSIYFPFAPGHFTFKLCPVPAEAEATQQCMDNNVLGLAFSVMDMMLIIQLSTLHIYRIQQSIT